MSADNNIQQDQQAREAALTTDQSAEEFFFKHAQKNGRTLQEGEHGYALQQAAKARAEGASLTERLADEPASDAAPPVDVHPSLRVPDSPLAYFEEIPVGAENHQEAAEVGTWLRAAEITTASGNLIAKAAAAAAREPMTDQAFDAATRALHRNLRQEWGSEYESNKAAVQGLIDTIDAKHGGKAWAWLEKNREVMTSAVFIKSLHSHLQRKRAK